MAKKTVDSKKPDPVELIDRIPSAKMNLKKLGDFCQSQILAIKSDRTSYMKRRERYIQSIDNFVDYDLGTTPFEGASQLHVPIIMEKLRATHARLYQAIFSVRPPFYVEPQEKLDVVRLTKIEQLMKWAVSRFVNYYKGINEVMDDAIWTFCADGWCFIRTRWDRKMRKAVVVEEEVQQPRRKVRDAVMPQDGALDVTPTLKFKEVEKWIEQFNGPVIENIQHENAFIPGQGDIQTVPLVAICSTLTAHDLKFMGMTNYFSSEDVDYALKFPNAEGSPPVEPQIQDLKGKNQGVETTLGTRDPSAFNNPSAEHDVYECFVSFDGDEDGFNEELVVHYHFRSNRVLRWTYLDRITKTQRRPIYQAGYIRRPGRNYHIGLCELLYSLGNEVDVIHNQRVDYGTITNMPFFFYEANSSLPNERITIAPGRGTPVDDVSKLLFPTIKGGTQWGFQEENLLFQIINRISSISDINVGQPNSSEMLRTQGGVSALLTEGIAPLDIALRRIQDMYSLILGDIHQMLVEKLPMEFQHMIVGSDEQAVMDATGNPELNLIANTRKEVAGKVHFHLQANSNAGNKQLMRQSRQQLLQQLLNPIALQLGVVSAGNIYELYEALLEVSDEPDIQRFITKPAQWAKPLPLIDELNSIKQGLMPEIPLNDDHQSKIAAISAWIQHPEVAEGIRQENISPIAPIVAHMVIQQHTEMAKAVAAQSQQLQNVTGGQVPQPPNSKGSLMPQGGQPAGTSPNPGPLQPQTPQQTPVATQPPQGGPPNGQAPH